MHDKKYPGESAEYRAARNELLQDEIALRQMTERVAAKRRSLPLGGVVPQDYVFDTSRGPLRMSQMFSDVKDTLVIYNFMFGPAMGQPCPF